MRTLLESNAQHLGSAVQTAHPGRPSWRHQANYQAGLLLLGIACGCSSSSNNNGGGGQATASGGTTAAAAGNTSAGGSNGTGGSAPASAGTTSNNAGGNSAGGTGGAAGGTAGSSSTCCSISSACNSCLTQQLTHRRMRNDRRFKYFIAALRKPVRHRSVHRRIQCRSLQSCVQLCNEHSVRIHGQ